MRIAASLVVVLACPSVAIGAPAEPETKYEQRDRELKRNLAIWWGTFGFFMVSGTAACVVAQRPSNKPGANIYCGFANAGALATLIGGIVVAVRRSHHKKIPYGARDCWPRCYASRRLRWDAARPLVLRF